MITVYVEEFTRRVVRVMPILAIVVAAGCEEPRVSSLQGQINTSFVFYGKAVDENGAGLAGATFECRIDTWPNEDIFKPENGVELIRKNVSAISGSDGRFSIEGQGISLAYRQIVPPPGYDMVFPDELALDCKALEGVKLMSWGQREYRPDRDNPAVYVFVKKGVKQVRVAPSLGGYSWGPPPGSKNTLGWVKNLPQWPKTPYPRGLVFKPGPSTAPTTNPAFKPNDGL
jgi:hypothetical protein